MSAWWRMMGVGVAVSATAALGQSLRLQWTDVWDATEYRVHLRQAATPWGTGTPLETRTPIWPTLTPGVPVAAWEAETDALVPGVYEVAVSACNTYGCSALSNTKVVGAGTPTETATPAVTATPTDTPTAGASATNSATATRTPSPSATRTATAVGAATPTPLMAPVLRRVEWAS